MKYADSAIAHRCSRVRDYWEVNTAAPRGLVTPVRRRYPDRRGVVAVGAAPPGEIPDPDPAADQGVEGVLESLHDAPLLISANAGTSSGMSSTARRRAVRMVSNSCCRRRGARPAWRPASTCGDSRPCRAPGSGRRANAAGPGADRPRAGPASAPPGSRRSRAGSRDFQRRPQAIGDGAGPLGGGRVHGAACAPNARETAASAARRRRMGSRLNGMSTAMTCTASRPAAGGWRPAAPRGLARTPAAEPAVHGTARCQAVELA